VGQGQHLGNAVRVRPRAARVSPPAPPPPVTLRPATAADCDLIWAQRNEESARAASVSTDPIPLSDHRSWYALALADPCITLLVAEDPPGGTPLGHVRLTRRPPTADTATISLVVDLAARGRSVGPAILRAATAWARTQYGLDAILALIRPDNAPSLRAFERAGYRHLGDRGERGVLVREFRLDLRAGVT
jgi:RimJ/RimL family protein N-acetyltransferase